MAARKALNAWQHFSHCTPTFKSSPPNFKTLRRQEIYDYFLQRKNAHQIGEANKLIATMLADIGKGQL